MLFKVTAVLALAVASVQGLVHPARDAMAMPGAELDARATTPNTLEARTFFHGCGLFKKPCLNGCRYWLHACNCDNIGHHGEVVSAATHILC